MHKDKVLTIEEIKIREVKILEAFDLFANKHSLRYWLFFGTLLGAARHEGFIPWDDDIDIVMPKNDYYRLIELTNSGHMLGDRFRFNSPSVEGGVSSQPFGKVYDMDTLVMHDSLVPIEGLDEGVWIDVFPMVGVDENTSTENSRYLKQFSLRYAFLRRSAQKFTLGESFVGTIRRLLAHIPARLGGVRHWGVQCEKIQNKLPDMFEKEFCLHASYPNEMYPTDLFLDESGQPAYLTFEGSLFPAPVQWDKALEITYGSWQELPPKDERVSNHSFSAYVR